MLNQLLSEQDLARLSNEQKDFLAQRIDFALDTSKEIHGILASRVQDAINNLSREAPVKGAKGVEGIKVLGSTGWSK